MSDNKDNDVETLDFNESPEEVVEKLDFDSDDLSNTEVISITDVNNSNNKSSIKNFNIKSEKTRKIVKKSMLYVIILMLLGFEIFINKAGRALDNIKVYASDNVPIRIYQNGKYGYIDIYGNKTVHPKYTYAENFKGQYAIVKNTSNKPLVIDKGGKEIIKADTYFSIYRARDDIVAGKKIRGKLKYGILDKNLKVKTKFIYDSISYKDGVYTYIYKNSVGLINEKGKRIYTYKLVDKDEKQIDVTPCPVTNNKYQRYGVVSVNGSNIIVNLNDGTAVTNATLNTITPDENNVFYETRSGDIKEYIYVQDNKIILDTEGYNSFSISSIETGVVRAMNADFEYEYISTKTLEQLEPNINDNDVYYGDGVLIYKTHDFKRNKDVYSFVKNGEVYKVIDAEYTIYKPFKNKIAIVTFSDGLYGYINEDGDLINNERYIEANEFSIYGDAIAKKDTGYGVLRKNGSTLIKFTNDDIEMVSDKIKLNFVKNKVFYSVKNDDRYVLYNRNGRKIDNTKYELLELNEDYPVVRASTEANDYIITTIDMNKIEVTSDSVDYEAFENYVRIKNEIYNYNGKLIYIDNSKKGVGDDE